MTHSATPASGASRQLAVLRILQAGSVLSVIVLAWQFVTAGELFPGGGPEELHDMGAIALHVATGITALAAIAYWRPVGGPLWPAVVAVLVFAASFVQAAYGARNSLGVHVPGAMVLTVGAVWVAAWAFTHARR